MNRSPQGSAPALECRNLVRHFGGVRALDELSLDVPEGQITAIIGPNGAGKTTLVHVLTGVLRPDAGQISYRGRRIDGMPAWRIARLGVGRLFQDVRLFNRLSVLDNVLVGFPNQRGERPSQLFLAPGKVDREQSGNRDAARTLLGWIRLQDRENARAHELSFGQQKRLGIARLLAAQAAVLLLDEPTAGVDRFMRREILELVGRLPRERGVTVVIIEHDMSVVAEIADRVAFVDQGRLVATGTPNEILGGPKVQSAYLGL